MSIENKKDVLYIYEKLLDSAMTINEQFKEQNDYLIKQLNDTNELLGNEDLILQQTVARIIEEIRDELRYLSSFVSSSDLRSAEIVRYPFLISMLIFSLENPGSSASTTYEFSVSRISVLKAEVCLSKNFLSSSSISLKGLYAVI